MNEISIIPVKGLPEVKKGDDLASMTFDLINKSGNEIKDNDIFVITQKIVSKSEGMERDLSEYKFEDLIKSEAKQIIRKRGDLIIAELKILQDYLKKYLMVQMTLKPLKFFQYAVSQYLSRMIALL